MRGAERRAKAVAIWPGTGGAAAAHGYDSICFGASKNRELQVTG